MVAHSKDVPSVGVVDAYKDRARQLEIENKRMRSQLGLNQHRPVSGKMETDVEKISARLARKTEKMKEVVQFARSLQTKYEERGIEIEELKKNNKALVEKLKETEKEKRNREKDLLKKVAELRKLLAQREKELDFQSENNLTLEKRLKSQENDYKQLSKLQQKECIPISKSSVFTNFSSTIAPCNNAATRNNADNKATSATKETAVMKKDAKVIKRSSIITKSTSSKFESQTASFVAKPLAAPALVYGDFAAKSTSSKSERQTASFAPKALASPAPVNTAKPPRALAPLTRKPSGSLTSLTDLPTLGGPSQPTTNLKAGSKKGEGKKKKGGKNKKKSKTVDGAEVSRLNNDIDSIFDALL